MKKIFIVLILTLFNSIPALSDKLLKDGFLNNKMDYAKEKILLMLKIR